MTIYPVPAGRSSDALLSQRMLTQLQSEQRQLLRVQQQLGTGRRIQLSSEDPSSASRATALQRILEIKKQLETNLSTTQSFLSATDTALSGVAELLANARGLAVRAADTTTSQLERDAMAMEIQATIRQMLDVGNETFRGRFLFAGSDSTVRPFESLDQYVVYEGNDQVLRTYADDDMLFPTNLPGQDLFGAVSAEVRGNDLDPVLTATTRISDLNRGRGVTRGAFIVSDGTNTSSIDISNAETLGDLVRLIEATPPQGREVHATIDARGLFIEMDAAGGGSLIVRDEQGGSTAAELGIERLSGRADDPIVGRDLDPILRVTTRLDDLVGVRARAIVRSPGRDNDIILEAFDRGAAMNGYTLRLVDDNLLQGAPGLAAGNEYAEFSDTPTAARAGLRLSGMDNDLILSAVAAGPQWNNVQIEIDSSQNLGNAAQIAFDAGSNTLRIEVDDTDQTTVGTLVAAINSSGLFTAAPDASMGEGFNPGAPVLAADAGFRGSTGNSGGDANTVFVYIEVGQSQAGQVVDAINANPDVSALFQAALDSQDSTNAALAGSGIVDVNASSVTAGGAGTDWDQGSGLEIVNAGKTFTIDLQPAETVEDLLNILNESDAMLLAEINRQQNGINIRSRLSGADFSIGENGGTTATELGLRTLTSDTLLNDLNYGRDLQVATGTDFTIRRNDGVELEIDVSSARTVGDVLDLINSHPDNLDPNTRVIARPAEFGNGIELVDDNPNGTDSLTVTRSTLSYAAWDLGLVARGENVTQPADPPAQAATATVQFAAPNDINTALRIVAGLPGNGLNDIDIEFRSTLVGDVATATFDGPGGRLIIDMADGQTTANTVINAVVTEGTFTAELDLTGDPTNNGTGSIVAPPGTAATTSGGTAETLVGFDTNPVETEGVFNSLIRLHAAIRDYNVEEISRVLEMLDIDFDRLNFGRAALGAEAQGLDALETRSQDEHVELRSALSDEIDIDLAEAASAFAARQAAYEASLRAMSTLHQLSLLDFI